MGCGFVFMFFAAKDAQIYGKSPMFWLILAYLFHTIGELCASPVILSFITKLSPKQLVASIMGIYFAAIGLGNKFAGSIGQYSEKLGEKTITVDCDVIQADGGTRTASITGGFVALCLALRTKEDESFYSSDVIDSFTGSVSIGKVDGEILLDLDYEEDSNAETDMNFIMNEKEEFVEIQGTAEKGSFSKDELDSMVLLASKGIKNIIEIQKKALNSYG